MRYLLTELRRGALADGSILLGLGAAWIVSVVLLASNGVNGLSLASYTLNFQLYVAALGAVLVVAITSTLARHRPEKPIGFLARTFVSSGLANRLLRGIPMAIALVIFLPIFSKMKAAIPLFNSYSWDGTWIDLDRALHGGDPWLIMQPLLGFPLVTSALSGFYHLWLLLLYVGAVYFCFFQEDRTLRARFFIAYFACWAILGVVVATMLASVGPCFVGVLLGDPRFDDQMAYLQSADEVFPVLVLPVQEKLASSFLQTDTGLGSGISAMPSMHVSIACLFFLATRKISHAAGWFFGIFLAIILIGSVHLAYHYAVDGYLSLAATWLIWMAAGVLARRMTKADANRARGVGPSAPVPVAPAFAPGSAAAGEGL